MVSTADSKDDTTQATEIAFLVLFGLYIVCLGYACYKFYKSFTEARVFRIIKGMIVAFLIRSLHTVRTIYWTDPLVDFPLTVYVSLEGIPNILLYNMGQMIAYEW